MREFRQGDLVRVRMFPSLQMDTVGSNPCLEFGPSPLFYGETGYVIEKRKFMSSTACRVYVPSTATRLGYFADQLELVIPAVFVKVRIV